MFQRVNIVTLAFFVLSGLAFSEQDVPVPQVDPELSKNALNKAFLALQEAETPPLAEVGGEKQVVSTLPHFQGGAKNSPEGLSTLHVLPEDVNNPPQGHAPKQVLSHAEPASLAQLNEGRTALVVNRVDGSHTPSDQVDQLNTQKTPGMKQPEKGGSPSSAMQVGDQGGTQSMFEKMGGGDGVIELAEWAEAFGQADRPPRDNKLSKDEFFAFWDDDSEAMMWEAFRNKDNNVFLAEWLEEFGDADKVTKEDLTKWQGAGLLNFKEFEDWYKNPGN